ncbi:hypothetical protein NLG97_g7069 [Lecanicillium saksenae]|uniref:Uncharacterized protein n=1 Tax=Lecanicillium saksenae TaxID=468837 RepID=A0ACC1QPJ0_9HYPO|nr:hypothetical protein NLG97_g7069 [Lecanicillium saksenae]
MKLETSDGVEKGTMCEVRSEGEVEELEVAEDETPDTAHATHDARMFGSQALNWRGRGRERRVGKRRATTDVSTTWEKLKLEKKTQAASPEKEEEKKCVGELRNGG